MQYVRLQKELNFIRIQLYPEEYSRLKKDNNKVVESDRSYNLIFISEKALKSWVEVGG